MLPEKFVIKCTSGSGGNIFVRSKANLNYNKTLRETEKWLKDHYEFSNGFELQYKNIIPRIMIEEYLEDTRGLPDYKFLCFDGKVYCVYYMEGRSERHESLKMAILDKEFNLLPVKRNNVQGFIQQPSRPENYDEMIEVAEKLSKGFSHVRVDLYNINGKIIFGELTFTGGGGFGMFDPDEFDFILGEQWHLPSK